jgi:hypothetical protein
MTVMKNPFALQPGEDVWMVGSAFGTPLVVKGWSWLPVAQFFTWLLMLQVARRGRPERPWSQQAAVAAGSTAALLGSEWCHNLAHTAAATWQPLILG